MRRNIFAAAALLFISCATATPAEDVGKRLDEILARHPKQTIAISYDDFATRRAQ